MNEDQIKDLEALIQSGASAEDIDAFLAATQQSAVDVGQISPGEAAAMQAGTSATFGALPAIMRGVDWLTGAVDEPGYVSPQDILREAEKQQPGASLVGTIGGALGSGFGAARGVAAIPQVARMGRLGQAGAQAAGGAGATALEAAGRGGDLANIAMAGLTGGVGGALGEAAGAGMRALGSRMKAGREAAKLASPQQDKVNKAMEAVDKITDTIDSMVAKAEAQTGRAKQQIVKELDKEKSRLYTEQNRAIKAFKELEKKAPTDKTSQEYVAYADAQKNLSNIQSAVDRLSRSIDDLKATAPTKLSKERESAIATAQRQAGRAEAKVLSTAEEMEVTKALKQMMEDTGKRRAPPVAAQPAPPAPAAMPDLTEQQMYVIAKAYASEDGAKTLRAIGEKIGMDKSTLSRRLKSFGITPENAAERVAEYEAKLAAAAPAASGAAPAASGKKASKGMFESYPMTAQEIRKVKASETALPVRQRFAAQQSEAAQEALQRASAPVGPIEESRFAAELSTRQGQLAAKQADLAEAARVRDELRAELDVSRSPEVKQRLKELIALAEANAAAAKNEVDRLTAQLESQAFKVEPPPQAMATQAAKLQSAQAILAEAEKELAAWRPGKEKMWAAKFPVKVYQAMVERLPAEYQAAIGTRALGRAGGRAAGVFDEE
jgi:predicted DNA binding protein